MGFDTDELNWALIQYPITVERVRQLRAQVQTLQVQAVQALQEQQQARQVEIREDERAVENLYGNLIRAQQQQIAQIEQNIQIQQQEASKEEGSLSQMSDELKSRLRNFEVVQAEYGRQLTVLKRMQRQAKLPASGVPRTQTGGRELLYYWRYYFVTFVS